MEDRSGEVAIVAILVLACAAVAHAQDGTATGTLTLNGTSTTLKYAYASPQPAFFDKKAEDIRVLLSDVPLPPSVRTDDVEMIKLARDDRARIVEVVLDARGEPLTGAIFAKPFNGMASLSGMHRFDRDRLDPTSVAGRLSVDAAHTFMDVTYRYDVTFSARIPRPPTPAEAAAALTTLPARAAAAYLAAVRNNRLADFLQTLAPAMSERYSGPDANRRFAELRAEIPPDTRLVKLDTQEDGTVVATLEGHERGIVVAYELTMVRIGDQWKVDK
jgi:hypothetical protein